MTAYISHRLADRIEILSDGAYVDECTGLLTNICGKAMGYPTLPLVMTGAGTTGDMQGFYGSILRPAFRDNFDDTMEALAKLSARMNRPRPGNHFAVLVAGWSEAKGFRHFHMSTDPDHSSKPCHFVEIEDPLFVAGMLSEPEMNAAGLELDLLQRDGLELRGPRFFQAFRKPVPSRVDPSVEPFCGVGGQLQLTTLTATGIDMRTIAYWPDWLGQRIDPARKFVPVLPVHATRRVA
jgi:hypothetical protein